MPEQAPEAPQEGSSPDETSEEDADEQPAIEEDEFADVDLDAIAEQAEEEAGADSEDDEVEEESSDESGEETESVRAPTGDSWGDMYVGTLTTVSNAVIDEHGKDGAEEIDESLARQLHMDEYMDDWMAKHGKREDMPPEQALMLSTAMFLAVVVGTKTDLPNQLLEEVNV